MVKVLVACEESQIVTTGFRARGIDAFSCDLLPTSGEYPEYHIQGDAISLLQEEWDAIIAFPPCTHLSNSGARWFARKRASGEQQDGIDFFMQFANARCDTIAIENPVGIMSRVWRKPDQIIQPYHYGDQVSKRTCLWLKTLPQLVPTNIVNPGNFITYPSGKRIHEFYKTTWSRSTSERAKARSKTFPGIAAAIVKQWGDVLESRYG